MVGIGPRAFDGQARGVRLEVADVFRRHGDAYRLAHVGHISRVEKKIMGAIVACRTPALGGHVEACDDCGVVRVAYALNLSRLLLETIKEKAEVTRC